MFLGNRFFLAGGCIIGAFVFSFFMPLLLPFAKGATLALAALAGVDAWLLLRRGTLEGSRTLPERFSNGDPNPVKLSFTNRYPFDVKLEVVDEVPFQFQLRDASFQLPVAAQAQQKIQYLLRPTERGEYDFGTMNVFAATPLGLLRRRFHIAAPAKIAVYPSFIQLRKYQLMAISNRLTDLGVKQVRRLGHTAEFEQIKEYVRGDDFRTVNWKASARTGKWMVNQYTDERAQHIYSLIDKSRLMQMPFDGMTLLDYAINASLVISDIALRKHDKAGLIAFAKDIDTTLPANNKASQLHEIQESLYNQKTDFMEADYARLYTHIRRTLNQRSLLLLFTNFESLQSMQRQLPYLQQLNKSHLLVVVFFENTELQSLLVSAPKRTDDIYIKAIGENFAFEKKQIVRELRRYGIQSLLTQPQHLTVNTLNEYIALKAQGRI